MPNSQSVSVLWKTLASVLDPSKLDKMADLILHLTGSEAVFLAQFSFPAPKGGVLGSAAYRALAVNRFDQESLRSLALQAGDDEPMTVDSSDSRIFVTRLIPENGPAIGVLALGFADHPTLPDLLEPLRSCLTQHVKLLSDHATLDARSRAWNQLPVATILSTLDGVVLDCNAVNKTTTGCKDCQADRWMIGQLIDFSPMTLDQIVQVIYRDGLWSGTVHIAKQPQLSVTATARLADLGSNQSILWCYDLLQANQSQGFPNSIRLGGLEINIDHRHVAFAGRALELTKSEFELLSRLVQADGQVVTTTSLLTGVYGSPLEHYRGSLRVHLANLRKKLVAANAPAELLQNIASVGYRFRKEALQQ